MKTKSVTAENMDEYISAFPVDTQEKLQKLRAVIKKAAPAATEAISYAIPTFTLHGNLVHFAGFNHHIGFYPGPGAIEVFKRELAKYHLSKGTVQFPLDKPIPVGLVSKIVKYRVKQDMEKAAAKKKK